MNDLDKFELNGGDSSLLRSFSYYFPKSPLSDFVSMFWYWEGHDVPQSKERILPTGTTELVINLSSRRICDSVVVGPNSKSFIIDRTSQDRLLGIHFKPGGAFPFLKFPFQDLHNIFISLEDLWGVSGASELVHLLHEQKTRQRKFKVLENWMLKSALRPMKHHSAVSYAMNRFQSELEPILMADVASKANLSQRRFIQLFQREVGITPKLFWRVQRFKRLIETLPKENDKINWLDTALSCGYFDQSHFIHDFQEFSGLKPNEFLTLRTEHIHHVKVRN